MFINQRYILLLKQGVYCSLDCLDSWECTGIRPNLNEWAVYKKGKESLAHRKGDLKLKTILIKQKICQVLQHMNTAMVFSIQYWIRSSVTVFYTEDLCAISYHLIKLSLVFMLMPKHFFDRLFSCLCMKITIFILQMS